MARPLTLRIAIADGEHARFVQPDADNVLRTSAHSTPHPPTCARATSAPIGQAARSRAATSAHHGVGQRHDLHAMEKEKFVRLVGEQLNAASARDEFDELLLVAPPRALHELREALDASRGETGRHAREGSGEDAGSRAVAACARMGQSGASPGA